MTLTFSCFRQPLAASIALFIGFISSIYGQVEIKAVSYSMMGVPPNLTGPMEQNFLLSEAERYKIGKLKGPESFVYHDGHIYTGLSDGRIVDISDCGVRTVARMSLPNCKGICSRPLGLRMAPNGILIVADSGFGILGVNVRTGQVQLIFSITTPINGRRCKFINDLVVARDGTILFTDSSAKWSRNEYLYIVLEGESSGRLIALSPRTRKAIVVLNRLSFPNGLEFTPNEEFLLIAETSRARIRRLDLRKGSSTWLQQSWFATNLPGLPDNIRASGRGTIWVAMSTSRNDNMTSSRVDQYAQQPEMRNMVAMMAGMDQIDNMSEKYGTIIEMDFNGNIIRSLQDPTGERVPSISEVLEADGFLYLGTFDKPYVSRVPLSPKFDVERFIARIRSTCRATKINISNLRSVLRRIVAIAELRKTLLEAKRRQEEMERALSTTTSASVTANTTDASVLNSTETTNENVTTVTVTTTVVTITSGSTPESVSATTTVADDAGTLTSTTSNPTDSEAGDGDSVSTANPSTTNPTASSESTATTGSSETSVTSQSSATTVSTASLEATSPSTAASTSSATTASLQTSTVASTPATTTTP